jgi:hypothetical protein
LNEDSKQQRQQDQHIDHEGTGAQKTEQKQNTGYGDKKLTGPDIPST